MCLERAFSGYLAYFVKVGLRSDTKGPKRGKEGEGLSPVDIGDRASDPDGEVKLVQTPNMANPACTTSLLQSQGSRWGINDYRGSIF